MLVNENEEQLQGDEELARRLQEEELNNLRSQNVNVNVEDLRAPLLNQENNDNDDSIQDVRRNMLLALIEIQDRSPILVMLFAIYGIIELSATITMVAIYWNVSCGDKPHQLQQWMIAFSSRFFLIIPCHVWRLRNPESSILMKRYLRWINILVFFMFLLGQKWIFHSNCIGTPLYTYCVIVSIFVITSFFLPMLMILAICTCAPQVLMIFRRFIRNGNGASEHDIESLPSHQYNPDSDETSGETQCSICITDYEVDETVITLPCNHCFHKECIEQWLGIKRECPLCRHDITEPSGL